MGTTSDHIRNNTGINLGYTIIVEGYKFILTDGTPAQAVAAHAGTLWSDALSGLEVKSSSNQSIKPWSNEVNVSDLVFGMVPDNTAGATADQFGIDMFKSKPSAKSELTIGFETDTSAGGGFNITVQDSSDFSASAVMFIDNEAFNVTSKPSGTTLGVAANGEGYFSPFGTSGGGANLFPGPHNIAADAVTNNYDSMAPVYATDIPTRWVGKKVACYVHRVVDGVYDVVAQAELWFAGTIETINELTDGTTSVQCVGIQQAILDSVVMEQQWTGKLKEGYKFRAGHTFGCKYKRYITGTTGTVSAADLICTTGASGTAEFEPGYYSATEILQLIGNWLDNDGSLGAGATNSVRWHATIRTTAGSLRTRIDADGAASTLSEFHLFVSEPSILEFLGWRPTNIVTFGTDRFGVKSPTDGDTSSLVSDDAPYSVIPIKKEIRVSPTGFLRPNIDLEQVSGTFIDHTSLLPHEGIQGVDSGEVWSYFTVGDSAVFLAEKTGDLTLADVRLDVGIAKIADGGDILIPGMRVGDPGDAPTIKQIFFATDTMTNMITKLLASTDGQGTNHPTFDVFAFGGAGIPWSLLGDNFTDSLKNLEQSGPEDSITIIIEKPTRIWDIIKSELMLRMAGFVWKDEGIQVAQLTVPSAIESDLDLTEINKGDDQRTTTERTTEFLVNTLKILYNRDPLTDKYTSERIIRDRAAYEASGQQAKTKTIKARNSYAGIGDSGSSIEGLADMITARFMPVFARPLRRWVRSINHQLFHHAPGSTATLTDDYVRNPTNGKRGIASRACTVMGISSSFGISSGGQEYFGEIETLYTEEDRLFPMSPTAQHRDVTSGAFTNGWDAANARIAVEDNEHSNTGETKDAARFTALDKVVVLEVDPADPTAADSFSDVVDAVNTTGVNYIELANGFGSGGRPAFSAAKSYRVVFDIYTTNLATQLNQAYLGDSVDGQILDTIEPNLYGDDKPILGFAAADVDLLPSRHSDESFAEGAPFSTGTMQDMIRMANSLANYKCTSNAPFIFTDDASGIDHVSGSATDYISSITFPFFVGRPKWNGGKERKVKIGIIMSSSNSPTSANARVTLSSTPPWGPVDGSFGNGLNLHFATPLQRAVFSSTTDGTGSAPFTWDYPTEASLSVVRAAFDPAFTWVTVEGGNDARIAGLYKLQLGPYE